MSAPCCPQAEQQPPGHLPGLRRPSVRSLRNSSSSYSLGSSWHFRHFFHDHRRGPGAGSSRGRRSRSNARPAFPGIPVKRQGVLAELGFRRAVCPLPERVVAVEPQLQEALVQPLVVALGFIVASSMVKLAGIGMEPSSSGYLWLTTTRGGPRGSIGARASWGRLHGTVSAAHSRGCLTPPSGRRADADWVTENQNRGDGLQQGGGDRVLERPAAQPLRGAQGWRARTGSPSRKEPGHRPAQGRWDGGGGGPSPGRRWQTASRSRGNSRRC